ncbi:putative uncharacterized protein DDB_G0291608, partial [Drosophila busckii]|uniref:putative uncharacterized protein DDB_G0291608 n=1 Tax=Drosophila busckii TaxID=30019 RepID=UPI0014328D79
MPNSSSSSHAHAQRVAHGAIANGHCSSASASAPASNSSSPRTQPTPPPPPPQRRQRVVISQEPARPQLKTSVTHTETARIMRSSERATPTSSPARQLQAAAACHCRCAPEDFAQTQLAPDKMEQQTCKLLESPKQRATPTVTPTKQQRQQQQQEQQQKCQEDEQLSLMLIGLAQFVPAAKLLQATPSIAVVPPTPDSVLTKTTTHVWDNSSGVGGGGGAGGSDHVTTATTATTTAKQPRQAIIENIPEDSCDESPLEEEPPYRPMSSALRRFGTMSSLEKLPSDELEDELDAYAQNGLNEQAEASHQDATAVQQQQQQQQDDDDNAEREHEDLEQEQLLPSCSSGQGDVLASGAWTNRAGAFVSDKMSFFEESRAFIDKYLGRWNANEQSQQQGNQTASETDEQLDECTSGATSGEEVWGTPTSGGDNDDMQLMNSENTHSSPTKSSTSLNDDDDTELMMDELLMAPPMTASTIRGLLPRFYRRRLEPLFEEETESDEEKTQQDSDDIKKVGGSNDKWPLPRGFGWKFKRRVLDEANAAAELPTQSGASARQAHAAAHYSHYECDANANSTISTTTSTTASGLILRVSTRTAAVCSRSRSQRSRSDSDDDNDDADDDDDD